MHISWVAAVRDAAAWTIATTVLICSLVWLRQHLLMSCLIVIASLRYRPGLQLVQLDQVFTTLTSPSLAGMLMLPLLSPWPHAAAGCQPEPVGKHRAFLSVTSILPEARIHAGEVRAAGVHVLRDPAAQLRLPGGRQVCSNQRVIVCRVLLLQQPVQRPAMQTVWRCCCLWSSSWLVTLRPRSGPPLSSSYQG